jgi:very-short-patch-repair endonuclease
MLRYNKQIVSLAGHLRKNMTHPERILWSRIRLKQLKGYQFYRQKPIADYIVDFYCPKAKLVIELDGSQHKSVGMIKKDSVKDTNLESLGLKVLRFNNNDVTENIDGVLERILSELD